LANLIDSTVLVKLVDGSMYEGKLVGIDLGDRLTLHLLLEDAKTRDGKVFYKVFIHGSRISEIICMEKPLFDPEEFAQYIQQRLSLPPGTVRVIKEARSVYVYDRYKITENGVEGAGGLASKLYSLWQEYMEQKRRGK
ncbi:MAG TPA: hypothetical protein ENG05_01645, partial [Acidilobales archaeon]|nr:hypothetical protein [Acidilobales archaeon]